MGTGVPSTSGRGTGGASTPSSAPRQPSPTQCPDLPPCSLGARARGDLLARVSPADPAGGRGRNDPTTTPPDGVAVPRRDAGGAGRPRAAASGVSRQAGEV